MWCFCAQLELSNTDCSKFPSPSERHLGGPSLLFCCMMALVVHCPAAFVMRSWRLGRQLSSVQQSTQCCVYGAADRALALGVEHTELVGAHRAGHLRRDLELQDHCTYGTKQRPWISSRQSLTHTLCICVDFWLLLTQCKATAVWQRIPPIFSPFSLCRFCMGWCWETYQHLLCFLRRDLATWRQFLFAVSDCLLSRHLLYLPALLQRLPCQVSVPNAVSGALTSLDSFCKPSVQAIAASFGPKQQFLSKVWLFEYSWAKL